MWHYSQHFRRVLKAIIHRANHSSHNQSCDREASCLVSFTTLSSEPQSIHSHPFRQNLNAHIHIEVQFHHSFDKENCLVWCCSFHFRRKFIHTENPLFTSSLTRQDCPTINSCSESVLPLYFLITRSRFLRTVL